MIDIRKLKELVRLMVENDLSEVDLRDTEEQVTLRRHGTSLPPPAFIHGGAGAPPVVHVAAPSVTDGAAVTSRAGAAGAAETEESLTRIESPMVGTFYAAADPDSPPFVSVGAVVQPETVVCLIEAMKIFNEIKAECAGTVERVIAKNGQAVEFGQTLFLVRPD
jgi:acetyl-CoA carboxylase biotin carboxyl carrier protein